MFCTVPGKCSTLPGGTGSQVADRLHEQREPARRSLTGRLLGTVTSEDRGRSPGYFYSTSVGPVLQQFGSDLFSFRPFEITPSPETEEQKATEQTEHSVASIP